MQALQASQVLRVVDVLKKIPPVWAIVGGYAAYIAALFCLLSLPIAVEQTSEVNWLDNAFTAVSAVSTTGLVTVDVGASYSLWGEGFILLAIQVGGLGYMTLGSFVLLAINHTLDGTRLRIGRLAFHLPPTFALRRFLLRVVAYTFCVEAAGAMVLCWEFSRTLDGSSWLWAGVFHSVSAFCTAGFSIFPDSLEGYSANMRVNATIAILSLAGALGFILFNDLWEKIRNWRDHRFSLTSKFILIASIGSISSSAVFLYLTESQFAEMAWQEHALVSIFQAVSALTTVGFNTYPISGISHSSLFLMVLLMTLGASPAGTGGGLKSTTWMTGLAALFSALGHGHSNRVYALGREIPTRRVVAAFAAITLYLLCLFVGIFLLLLVSPTTPIADLMFEAVSALGTVGLSTGITSDLSGAALWTVIALMFVGRVGPLTIALALAAMLPDSDRDGKATATREEDLAL